MITADKDLAYQQNLEDRKLALVLPIGRWPHLKPYIDEVVETVDRAIPGGYREIKPRTSSSSNFNHRYEAVSKTIASMTILF
jgi:hypothetical protein